MRAERKTTQKIIKSGNAQNEMKKFSNKQMYFYDFYDFMTYHCMVIASKYARIFIHLYTFFLMLLPLHRNGWMLDALQIALLKLNPFVKRRRHRCIQYQRPCDLIDERIISTLYLLKVVMESRICKWDVCLQSENFAILIYSLFLS